MAETDPTFSETVAPPEVGELLRVTYWHATNEIDVVPEASVVGYPDIPNGDTDLVPPDLKIHAAPTAAITSRAFQEYCRLYMAVGPGTFLLPKVGEATGIPYINVWQEIRRLRKTLPENLLDVDMREPVIRRRTITLGNAALAETKRELSTAEREAREPMHVALSEEQQAAHERQAMYRLKARVMELQADDCEKRKLHNYNHVVLSIEGRAMLLDLTTIEGRLAFRYIEGLKKIQTGLTTNNRFVMVAGINKQVWGAMSIAERLEYATKLEDVYNRNGTILGMPLRHMRKYFHSTPLAHGKPITERRDRGCFVFKNPKITATFSQNEPTGSVSALPRIEVPPFPEKIAVQLPKTAVRLPGFMESQKRARP